jgi:nitrate/nitrite transport system permease protein
MTSLDAPPATAPHDATRPGPAQADAPQDAPEQPDRVGAFAVLRGRVVGLVTGLGWALVGLVVFGTLWQFAASGTESVPTPLEGARTLSQLWSDPFSSTTNDKGIGLQLFISLQRVFLGFACAAVVGVALGLLMGAIRPVWQAVNPLVQVLRPVSPLAWFPIWLYIIKDAGVAAVVVVFITALWPTLINTAAGAGSIPRDQYNVSKVFRFGPMAYLWHVLIPNALPSIITGLRLSMGIGWMVIIAAEMLSGNSGIGYFVWNSYNALELDKVVAAIVCIGVIGLALDVVLLRISRWVTPEEVHA